MTTTTPLMTEEDLLRLPQDHLRHELVKGELRTMPPTNSEHGAITVNLAGPLWVHVRKNKLGPLFAAETGFVLSRNPDTVLAPDIAFIAASRVPTTGLPKKFFPGPPDLAVEVVSPGDTVFEVDEKVQDWLDAGTKLVWIVNPKFRTVTTHAPGRGPVILTADQQLDGEAVVPGFNIPVREIFV